MGQITTPYTPADIHPHQLECVKARIVSVAYDNGKSPGSSDGPGAPNFIHYSWIFASSVFSINCKDVDTGVIGPYSQWTPQLQGWADAHNAVLPANYVAAFGRKPATTWRYDKITTCDPDAVFGKWVLTRDNGGIYTVYPVCKQEETVRAWRYFTENKDGTKTLNWCAPDPNDATRYVEAKPPTWQPVEGGALEVIPESCLVPCDYQFSDCIKEDAISSCTTEEINLCDLANPDDEESKVEFVRVIDTCADGRIYESDYTLDSWQNAQAPDELVEYELIGNPVYCDTCEPFDDCPDRVTVKDVKCVESQEWTYGIDNTGTRFNDVATYCLELSDGSTLEWSQDGSSTSWTPQLIEWSTNIQAAADDAGLAWFVEPRFVDNPNPPNIDGTINGPGGTPSGLPGAPSVPIAVALVDGGMAWRYVNFQICPGQPVPVRAYRKTSALYGDGLTELTAAGAVLGPIQKFWICVQCGKEPVWYLEDGKTLASEGQIPNCWEPCGTLALTDSPPDRTCEFFFSEACDNVGEPDDNANWTNLVTRRATVCQGEQIGVEYFVPDPSDPASLVPYTLIGEFVDCDTGDVIELPPIECDNPQVKRIWRVKSSGVNGINAQRWLDNAADHGPTGNQFTDCKTHINGDADESVVVTSDWALTDNDFPNTPSFAVSQELYYAWIYLPKPAVLRDTNGNTGEWISAFVGGCGQKPKKVAEAGVTASGSVGLGEFRELAAGVYQIVFQVSDFSVFGGITLQESIDGGATFNTFPMSRTFAQQPEINCDCIAVCDTQITELDGTLIDFDPDSMSWCEIVCPVVTVPEDEIPDYEFETTDGCDSVDGNSANYVGVTRETVFINGTPTTQFFTDYGDDTLQASYTLVGEFVNCATGEVIDDPEPPPCSSTSYAGVLWRVKDTSSLLTTVDYWGGPNYPGGQASAPHGNVSDIFTVSADGRTLEHSVGPPSITFTASFTDIRTSNADFVAATNAGSNTGTNGNDQIRVRGYVILNEPALLRDVNPNTGERGGIWLNKCCAGDLQLLFEDTTDSVSGDTGIFNNVRVPAGRHYFEAVTSDLSAWQGFQLDASFDDGATYAPLPIYDIKPQYECIPLARCDDTGRLLHADTGETVIVGPNDLRCEPPACIADSAATTATQAATLRII